MITCYLKLYEEGEVKNINGVQPYKLLQLLVSIVLCACRTHIVQRMRRKATINSHHALAPSTFGLANPLASMDRIGRDQ